jgi:hypothetical protein
VFWAGTSVLDVYLGTRVVAACSAKNRKFVAAASGREDALGKLADWLNESKIATRVRVWLSGGLCRPLCMPALGKMPRREVELIAVSLAAERFGWREACEVRIDAAGQGDIAVVAEQSTMHLLSDAMRKAGLSTEGIRPWWAEPLRHAVHLKLESFAIHDCDSVCVLAGSANSVDRASAISPVSDRESAESAISRTSFSWDLPAIAASAHLHLTREPTNAEQGTYALCEWVEWTQ